MNSSKAEPLLAFSFSDFKGKLAQIPLGIWLFALIVFAGSLYLFPQGGFDWRNDIGPGARHWWPAPWDEGLILAPWGAMILSPLGGLPDRIATALTNGFSVIIIALVARRLGGPAWIAIPVLISPAGILALPKRSNRVACARRFTFLKWIRPAISDAQASSCNRRTHPQA